MPYKFNITKEELYQLYIVENKTRQYCADYYGCSSGLIKIKIREYKMQKPRELYVKNTERKETLTCQWCHTQFLVTRFRAVNEKWKHKYCSVSCQIESQRNRVSEEQKKETIRKITARRMSRMKAAYDETANQEVIKEMYLEAKRLTQETGIPHEVDHIIPISRGGKHHEDNMRVVTAAENRRKGSKLLEELNQPNKNVETYRKNDQS